MEEFNGFFYQRLSEENIEASFKDPRRPSLNEKN